MDTQDILSQVNILFKKIFENENISVNMETTANDVDEWDSLNHTAMISEMERHFNIKFKLKEMLGFKNVGDMVNTIHSKLQESNY
jgi:acyl carrier protein